MSSQKKTSEEKPKEAKAAVEVVRRAVRKKEEEKSGPAGGRSEVRCFSAASVRGPISGRESIPVEKIAAPQTQKGRRNPETVNMKEPKTGPRLNPRPKVVSRRA